MKDRTQFTNKSDGVHPLPGRRWELYVQVHPPRLFSIFSLSSYFFFFFFLLLLLLLLLLFLIFLCSLFYIYYFFFSLEFKHLFSFLFSFTSPLHNDFSRAYIFIILIQFIHFIHYSLTAYILLIISSLYDVLCNAFQKVLIKLLNNVWVIYENYLKKHRLSEETI